MIERLMEALGERPLVTLDEICDDLRLGRGHLLTTPRSAIFVNVDSYLRAGERVANVGPAAGDLNEILEALPHFEEWARSEACTQVHVHGRRGWVRALAKHGYEEFSVITRKILSD